MTKKYIIKDFDCDIFRITVEEIGPFKFIATEWEKSYCLESDRKVFEFETCGGAMDQAFELLSAWTRGFLQVEKDNKGDVSEKVNV